MSGLGRGATGELRVDGKVVATQKIDRTIPLILQWDESFDIASDTGTPVNDRDYQVPFALTGRLDKLTVKVDRPTLTAEDERRLREAQALARDSFVPTSGALEAGKPANR